MKCIMTHVEGPVDESNPVFTVLNVRYVAVHLVALLPVSSVTMGSYVRSEATSCLSILFYFSAMTNIFHLSI
jgi:hypothetical protein